MRRHIGTSIIGAVLLALLGLGTAGTANAGTPDLKTYFPVDFTDQKYQAAVHRSVGMAWERPEPPEPGTKTVVIATFLRDGSLLESRIHMSSGAKAWDESGIGAVKKASPLAPLPKTYERTSVEIHFHFEYNE